MNMQQERDEVVEYCRKLGASGLSAGTSGNISIYNEAQGLVAMSPSSMDYQHMKAADVVLLDLAGGLIDGQRRPSTEHDMHLACYRGRSDLGAIVHTHSPQATTLAVLGWDLPAVHYMIGYSGGAHIRCAPYHLFGTPELAAAAVEHMGTGYACLLQNHGTLAAGPNMEHAWALTEQIEFCAGLYLRARSLGSPTVLTDQQMNEVIKKLADYTPQRQGSTGAS